MTWGRVRSTPRRRRESRRNRSSSASPPRKKNSRPARNGYTYGQDVRVQTLDGDTVDGEYRQVFDVSFDDKGHKTGAKSSLPRSPPWRTAEFP